MVKKGIGGTRHSARNSSRHVALAFLGQEEIDEYSGSPFTRFVVHGLATRAAAQGFPYFKSRVAREAARDV